MTRARDVADAGHATTATTADTISQKTSINLSGTYSTHQLLVADAYNFAGDTTVNDNLILGKISDDGNDLVLEGSHTLQGTGQLEAGYVTSSGISADSLTGTLGSGVSIGSGVTGTLGSGVTLPAGHVLQTVSGFSRAHLSGSVNYIDILTVSITPSSTSNRVLITASLSAFSNVNHVGIQVLRNGTLIGQGTGSSLSAMVSASFDNNNYGSNTNGSFGTNAINYLDSPSSTSAVSYVFRIQQVSGTSLLYVNMSPSGYQGSSSNATLMEIAG